MTSAENNAGDGVSIGDQLAAFGITHEPGDAYGRRLLKFNGQPIGLADAMEAVNLLATIRAAIALARGGE